MSERIMRVPVSGTWIRHTPAGADGLAAGHGSGRFHRAGQVAVYLADSEQTAWAEWYRWLAEQAYPPSIGVPRDLHRITVELSDVVDLRTMAARTAAGAPSRVRPTSGQWPAFQAVGERLASAGAQGILYSSAARTRSLCLCVFEAGLSRVRVEGDPVRVIAPPPPPRGRATRPPLRRSSNALVTFPRINGPRF